MCVIWRALPTAGHKPPTAGSAPAQRAPHEPTGTLRRHAVCSPAASRPPPPAPRNVPASRRVRREILARSMRRASCPETSGAMRVEGGATLILRLPAAVHVANPALPASARYVAPRRRGGAALRALRLRSGTRQRHRLPARWPCASRAPLLGSSHARGARGCPSGQRGREGTPSRRRRVLRAARLCAHAVRECGAPREVRRGPASLRSHRAASGFG